MSTQIPAKKSNVKGKQMTRRDFLKYNSSIAALPLLYGCMSNPAFDPSPQGSLLLTPDRMLGGLKKTSGPDFIEGATWYIADAPDDGLYFEFKKGSLADAIYLTSDLFCDGDDLAVFNVTLQEGKNGPAFSLRFGLITQCSARMRIPLSLVDMNRWRIDREGPWLKPTTSGSRVDLKKVDRMTYKVLRKNDKPLRWAMTPILAARHQVPRITDPLLPKGKLLDEFGQSTLRTFPGKTKNVRQLTERLRSQLKNAPQQKWPDNFSKWGGWKEKKFHASGFFQKHHDGKRWWLLDPDGYAFFSAGIDCVGPNISAAVNGLESALTFKPDPDGPYKDMYSRPGRSSVNYLTANLIRAFGASWRQEWEKIALAQLRQLGFNTVGNWSDWRIASKAKFPYVRPMRFRQRQTKMIYRDFPDVFDPAFQTDAEDYARSLKRTVDDPALIGYFMMNEPTWAFSEEIPAAGMLLNAFPSATRKQLAQFIKKRYSADSAFASAWQIDASFEELADGKWKHPLKPAAIKDLEAFSEIMVEKLFKTLSDECKKIDSNHMNLGIRYYTTPPEWAMRGMRFFDVFSMNFYRKKIDADALKMVHEKLNMPTIIGEFHFGALDVGLPASGIGHVKTQTDRGKAYRLYVEDAAANPYCVGTHWFTLYDQSALGRFDGENYNIGFYDICNRQHKPLCDAAKKTHYALYDVASNIIPPYDDEPEYLPKLFL